MSTGSPTRTVSVSDGLVVLPFRALRYALPPGGDLAVLTSPPYDVVDDEKARRLEAADPHNVVRLILPRDDAGPGSRYDRAARTLRGWIRSGVLRRDDEPALYVYEERAGEHLQRGLLGAVGLADPEAGTVLPHEDTMAGPVADRLALTRATRTNLEPIFLLYDGGGGGAASRTVTDAAATPPLLETTTDDGVRHRMWAVTDPEVLAEVARDLHDRRAVIADGHHRYATYRRYQAERDTAGDGPGPWDAGLAYLVDAASGPRVHAIHRAVPGLPVAVAARQAGAGFRVRAVEAATEGVLDELARAGQGGHAFALSDGREAFLLTDPDPAQIAEALSHDRSDAFRRLDVTVAHALLIQRLWGLDDREDVVGYHHDATSAVAAAAGSGGTALLLNPTPVADVIAVAAAGERMPRKSTLFTPKPRTGLVLRTLDDDDHVVPPG